MDLTEKPIVDKTYQLHKMPGKGGWTYALIPEIEQDKHAWFGWVKVRGTIDGYEISNYHLMPMGDGTLFLPVKAEIRKTIGKQEGDVVHVTLFSMDLPPVLEEDFLTCLKDEPQAFEKFNSLSANEQKKLTDWIYSVRNDQLRVERIVQTIEKLLNTK
jgi:hypothetical protein